MKSKVNLFEKFVPALLVITIGLVFLVGILWQKVASLEKGSGQLLDTSQPVGRAANPNGKLSDEQAKKVAKVTDTDYVRGNKDAAVFLIEYSDLECPFCKQFHTTAQQAVDEYAGKLAWVYRHFPLDTIHPKADKEAEAAECAGSLGGEEAFWTYLDKVFEVTPSNNGLALEDLPKIAGQIGLNQNSFNSCLESGKFKNKVEEQYQSGVKAGVAGTPGNFIMNKKGEVWVIPGAVPFESLKTVIDEALKS